MKKYVFWAILCFLLLLGAAQAQPASVEPNSITCQTWQGEFHCSATTHFKLSSEELLRVASRVAAKTTTLVVIDSDSLSVVFDSEAKLYHVVQDNWKSLAARTSVKDIRNELVAVIARKREE